MPWTLKTHLLFEEGRWSTSLHPHQFGTERYQSGEYLSGPLSLFLPRERYFLCHPGSETVLPEITTPLYILACQALPRFSVKYELDADFPSEISVPNLSRSQAKALEDLRRRALAKLFEEQGLSWWDVFNASDIGSERMKIVEQQIPTGSVVLDAGCGRGFFSFACSRVARHVVGIDLMDGNGRLGWWEELGSSLRLLEIGKRVSGARATVAQFPFRPQSFDVVASVHAIRNFPRTSEVERLIAEAKRVLKRNGRLVIVESQINRRTIGSYSAFYSLRTKIGWEFTIPTSELIARWMRMHGFSSVSEDMLETELKYAPVYFPFDPSLMKGHEEEYEAAERMLIEDGERHPPVSIISGTS